MVDIGFTLIILPVAPPLNRVNRKGHDLPFTALRARDCAKGSPRPRLAAAVRGVDDEGPVSVRFNNIVSSRGANAAIVCLPGTHSRQPELCLDLLLGYQRWTDRDATSSMHSAASAPGQPNDRALRAKLIRSPMRGLGPNDRRPVRRATMKNRFPDGLVRHSRRQRSSRHWDLVASLARRFYPKARKALAFQFLLIGCPRCRIAPSREKLLYVLHSGSNVQGRTCLQPTAQKIRCRVADIAIAGLAALAFGEVFLQSGLAKAVQPDGQPATSTRVNAPNIVERWQAFQGGVGKR